LFLFSLPSWIEGKKGRGGKWKLINSTSLCLGILNEGEGRETEKISLSFLPLLLMFIHPQNKRNRREREDF